MTARPETGPDAVRLIVTGGTFDKLYDEVSGALTFGESHLPLILRHARIAAPVNLEVTRLVDSLDMTDDDRAQILAACRLAPESRIVVIHGTDTMTETARVLGLAALGKTIVMTGAMVPYAVAGSDSVFNLGYALAAAHLLPAGVWIAIHGRTFAWDGVQKNRAAGQFQAKERFQVFTPPTQSGSENRE